MSLLDQLEQHRSSFLSLPINRSKVPRIIHQIYLNFSDKPGPVEIPFKWKSSPEAWKKYHPNFKYVLWNDKMLEELMTKFYPHYLRMYQDYPYPIQKVDVGRTFILDRYGGVYSDLDLEPTCNLEHLFSGQEDVYLVQDSGRYTNMLMGSHINSPFWPRLWNKFRQPAVPWWANLHHFYIQATTGPLILDKVVKSYPRTIGLLPGKYIQPCSACQSKPCTNQNAYFVMLDGGSWNKMDTLLIEMFTCHWPEILIVILVVIIILIIYWRG